MTLCRSCPVHRKKLKKWEAIKQQLRSELIGEMHDLNVTGGEGLTLTEVRHRWAGRVLHRSFH